MNPAARQYDGLEPSSDSPDFYRIAIVGLGPKGLWCFERLVDQYRHLHTAPPVLVTIFEPTGLPGAGNVYDPGQPHFLRMNFATRHIDAWVRDSSGMIADCRSGQLSLEQWLLETRNLKADPDGVVPRAVAGEYLMYCFEQIMNNLPDGLLVEVLKESVDDVVRTETGWKVKTSDACVATHEVLLATGHGGWRPAWELANIGKSNPTAQIIDRVFPVEKNLHVDVIPPGSKIGVCGFALTSIDAILAMTEGRGGTFSCHADGFTYRRSGGEPAAIYPFSRTGKTMFAKPDASKVALPPELDSLWQQGRSMIGALRRSSRQISFIMSVWPTIKQFAHRAFQLAGSGHDVKMCGSTSIDNWLEDWDQQPATAETQLALLRSSYGVATGKNVPAEAWALGEAWRQLYPSIVDCVSYGGLPPKEWPEFISIAAQMEKIAFGPPAENVGRLIALVEAGVVNLDCLMSTVISDVDGLHLDCGKGRTGLDVMVSAVIPAIDDHPPDSVIGKLLSRGTLSRMESGGIIVDASCRAMSRSACDESVTRVAAGLSLIGRSTEGCVLGNDTLSRSLHGNADAWAASVLQSLRCDESSEEIATAPNRCTSIAESCPG